MNVRKVIGGRIKKELSSIKDNSAINYIKRPAFQMSGNRELFTEGQIYVETYTDKNIVFSASGMNIIVSGNELSMCFYNKNLLKISGYIENVKFV